MLTNEIQKEIRDLIEALENLKESSVISKEYNSYLSYYVNKLTHRTKHLLAFYKIENKTNLLTFNWDTIKASFRYLPNTINYIVVKHELDEMSDIEMGNYLMNRNHNYDIGKKDILLKKYGNCKIIRTNLSKHNDIVFTLLEI